MSRRKIKKKKKKIRKSFFSRPLTTSDKEAKATGKIRTEQMPTAMHPSTLKTTHMVQL